MAEGSGSTTNIANPQATSSGNVTNQAMQILQGQYFQNGFGGGVFCQGTSLTISPFYIGGVRAPEFEHKNDYGLSMQISMPLDGRNVENCHERARIANQRQQAEADKAMLDYNLVRALKCTDLIKAGAFLHQNSPYAGLCQDVIAPGPDGVYRTGTGQVIQQVATSPLSNQPSSSSEVSQSVALPEVSSPSSPDQTEVSQRRRSQLPPQLRRPQ